MRDVEASSVFSARVRGHDVGAVQEAVSRAMDGIDWSGAFRNRQGSLFVKLNCMSGEPVPGTCTSPWVVDGFLAKVRSEMPALKIYLGDADGYSVKQVEDYMKNWHVDKLCAKYDAIPVNLSKAKARCVNVGPVLGEHNMPEILLEADQLVTLPVVKTHCLTRMTGALKNQWGLLPKIRYQFHPVVHQAIAELNQFFDKMIFAVADMTISQEGPGPRCGIPRVMDTILASRDRVALDAAAAWYIGLGPENVPTIEECERLGVGTSTFELIGDPLEVTPLRPAVSRDHVLYRWRDRLQKVSILNKVLFEFKPVYYLLGKFARFYNKKIWYDRTGVKLARKILEHPLYGQEYREILCRE